MSGPRGRLLAALTLAAAGLLAGCGSEDKTATSAPPAASPAPAAPSAASPTGEPRAGEPVTATARAGDAAKGRQVWLAQCAACHNLDPAKDGPVGPAVAGSSRALLEARVLRGEYPPGYTPKRPTQVMPPRPDLAPSLPDLAAYLR